MSIYYYYCNDWGQATNPSFLFVSGVTKNKVIINT